MDRKTVALLGSACNPPTLAHLDVLEVGLAYVDEAWLMPCYNHVYGKTLAPAEHRLAMCQLMERDRIRAFDFEIQHQLGGETYHTICKLMVEQMPYEFSFLIGMDVANTIHQWSNSDRLRQIIPFIVVDREGVERDLKVNWYAKWPHILATPLKRRATSSRSVREMLATNDPQAAEHLTPPVLAYIKEHHLYGT